MRFDDYKPEDFYDELFVAEGKPRPEAIPLIERINSLSTVDERLAFTISTVR